MFVHDRQRFLLLLVLPEFANSDASDDAAGFQQRQGSARRTSPLPGEKSASVEGRSLLPEVPVSSDGLFDTDRTLHARPGTLSSNTGSQLQSGRSPLHDALASASPGTAWQREGYTRTSWQPLLPHKSESGFILRVPLLSACS